MFYLADRIRFTAMMESNAGSAGTVLALPFLINNRTSRGVVRFEWILFNRVVSIFLPFGMNGKGWLNERIHLHIEAYSSIT